MQAAKPSAKKTVKKAPTTASPAGKKKKSAKKAAAKGRRPTKKDFLDPVSRRGAVASSCSAVLDAVAARNGNSVTYMVGEMTSLLVGIPFPSLALEWLTENRTFPMGRVMTIVGKEGSCKSALGVEIHRWARKWCDGWGIVFDAESKFSMELAQSILGWDDPKALGYTSCKSQEEWMHKLQTAQRNFIKQWGGTKQTRGIGRFYPVTFILDSLSGRDSLETIGKIAEQGSPGRTFSIESMKNTKLLRKIAADIENEPFTLIIVNHLKDGEDLGYGQKERKRPGGVHTLFQQTFEFETRVRRRTYRQANEKRIDLGIACYKNSLGVTGRAIEVTFCFRKEEDPKDSSRLRQVSYFDWHTSTMRMIDWLGANDPPVGKKVLEITGLRKKNNNAYYSTLLGIPKTKPATARATGLAIHKNKEMKAKLRNTLGISSLGKSFIKNVDYNDQRGVVVTAVDKHLDDA